MNDNLSSLSEIDRQILNKRSQWLKTARGKQLTPTGDWKVWIALAGRGWGKTRTFAEDIFWYAYCNPKSICGVIAPSHQNCLDICFKRGGLFDIIPDAFVLRKNERPVRMELLNGSSIIGLTADEPEKIRGYQFSRVWCDELASWRYVDEVWDQINFSTRLSKNPQIIISTTPKPVSLLRKLMDAHDTKLVTGSTFENVNNLAPSFISTVREKYEGTRMGRQELYGEILDDYEGSLWNRTMIQKASCRDYLDSTREQIRQKMSKIVIGVDPAVTTGETSDLTGIMVCGKGHDGLLYVLEDASGRYSPAEWANKVSNLFQIYNANLVVAETNQGGDLVLHTLRNTDQNLPVKKIHAKKGKFTRAEPVSALYEQNKVKHITLLDSKYTNRLIALEDEMCCFIPDQIDTTKNDRVDSLVYALLELSLKIDFSKEFNKFINNGLQVINF